MSEVPPPEGDAPPAERLRFDELTLDSFPDSHCEARISLTSPRGALIVRRVAGPDTAEGRLRAAAQATLEAASEAAGSGIVLELAGAKSVRAFDSSVVIVAIRARAEEQNYRLTGCYAIQVDEEHRGAALATLDALNRVLVPFLV